MNTVASLPDRLRFMVADGRNMGVNQQTIDLAVLEEAAVALSTPAVEGGLPKFPNGMPKWSFLRVPNSGPELVERKEAEARIAEARLATPEQPGSAVQGDGQSALWALRQILHDLDNEPRVDPAVLRVAGELVARNPIADLTAPVGVDALNASIVREAADLLAAVSDSGVQLPETWRWSLIDELRGIAGLASKAPGAGA